MEITLQSGMYYLDFSNEISDGKIKLNEIRLIMPSGGAPLIPSLSNSAPAPRQTPYIKLWADFKAWYLSYLDNSALAQGTKAPQMLAIRRLDGFRRPLYLREITPEYLMEFKAWLEATSDPARKIPFAGINRTVLAVKTMMRSAEDFNKIETRQNWALVKKDKRENGGRVVWHTIEELRQIRGFMDGDLLTAFFLGWEEGLRRAEMAFLYKDDYDPVNHTITIRAKENWLPKTKKSARVIPLRPDSEAAIRSSIARAPADSRFIINYSGDRKSTYYLSGLYIWRVKSKLPHIKSFLHKLRHTYGSLLAQQGVPLKEICDLMGHSSILQTAIYIHYADKSRAKAITRLPALS
jgi:integrase